MKTVLLIMLLLPSTGFAKNWYVSNASLGDASGDSWANVVDYSLLGPADPQPGDTVFFDGGIDSLEYASSNFTGNTNIAMMIQADGTAENWIVFTRGLETGHNGTPILAVPNRTQIYLNGANYVAISRLRFRPNSTVMSGYHYGVTAQDNSSNVDIHDNEFDYTYGRGYGIGGGIHQKVRHNYFYTQDVDGSEGSDAFRKQNDAIQGVSGREVEIAYNIITNSTSVEYFGNDGTHPQPHRDLLQISQQNPDNGIFRIHHNFLGAFMKDSVRTHINTFKANDTQGTYLIYDNVIAVYRAGSDLSFDTNDPSDPDYSSGSPATAYPLNVQLYNNTFVYTKGANIADVYFVLKGNVDGFTFKNNVFYSEANDPGGSVSIAGCVYDIDYNQYQLGADDFWGHSTWSAWQTAGHDLHSERSGVSFAASDFDSFHTDPVDYALLLASSGINEGTDLSSLAIFTDDYAGTLRPQGNAWDVGAFELVPPGAPCVDNDGDSYGNPAANCTPTEVDCDDSDNQIHPGALERCNGKDDDCDGAIDEAFPLLGTSCTVGQGACLRTGTFVCPGEGGAATCNVVAGTPTAEVCEGSVDEDCDGLIDGTDLGDCDSLVPTSTVQGGCDCRQSTPTGGILLLAVVLMTIGARRRRGVMA